MSSEPKIFFSILSYHQECDHGINLWYYQTPLVPQIISKSICVRQLYYRFPSKRLDREFGRFNGRCNLAAVSFQRAKTHTVRRAWISLPPHFIAHRLASRSASSLVCQRSGGRGEDLARPETCSRGLHQEQQTNCLKRRAGMCRSSFCEQMFARCACLLKALTASSSFMNYFVLTSEAAERRRWKDGLR